MRYVLILVVFSLLNSCSKDERFNKKVEGQWTLTKKIFSDGNEIVLNDTYIFQGGSSADGLPLSIYGSDTLFYKYLVNKKATEIKFIDASSGNEIEKWTLDFIDKDNLVLKTGYAIMLFER